MEVNKFIEKDVNKIFPSFNNNKEENFKNIIFSYSSKKNIFLVAINGILLYKGKFNSEKNDINLNKINLFKEKKTSLFSNNNNENNFKKKIMKI